MQRYSVPLSYLNLKKNSGKLSEMHIPTGLKCGKACPRSIRIDCTAPPPMSQFADLGHIKKKKKIHIHRLNSKITPFEDFVIPTKNMKFDFHSGLI